MKTNKTMLNFEEMEMVTGGGAVHITAKKKLARKIIKWISSWFD